MSTPAIPAPPRPTAAPRRPAPLFRRALPLLPPALLLVLFGAVIIRKAWICDDACITFRTIDHFVHGHGLRFNIDERVQVFTHPLWMFLIAPFYALTGEPFYTSLALSIVLSLAVAALVGFRLALSPEAGALGLLALTASRAFTDYATSGLENPLAHALLALFLLTWPRDDAPPHAAAGKSGRLILLAALLGTTRIDLLLLLLPALGLVVLRRPRNLRFKTLVLGSLPLLLWEGFSLFYYGSLAPNTAYAKLRTGISESELLGRGLEYLANSIRLDPVTLPVIAAGLLLAIFFGAARGRALAAGIALYLVYVTAIGGDFMSGRFLTTPLLVSVALILRLPRPPRLMRLAAAGVAIAAIALWAAASIPAPRSAAGATPEALDNPALDRNGIADERRVYEATSSLRGASRQKVWPNPRAFEQAAEARSDWINQSWLASLQGFGIADPREAAPADLAERAGDRSLTPVVARGSIGCFGFYLGPSIHLLDFQALADPLLARLPVMDRDPMLPVLTPRLASKKWRIGHFPRRIPLGYFETLVTGENRIRDRDLAAYYDALALITRGDLWDPRRLAAIARMNLGLYDRLLAASRAASTREGKEQAEANSPTVIQAKAWCSDERTTSPDALRPR